MDESLYDEFGNYIGPELSDSEEVSPPSHHKHLLCLSRHQTTSFPLSSNHKQDEQPQYHTTTIDDDEEDDEEEEGHPMDEDLSLQQYNAYDQQQGGNAMQVVLHEDKKYYPSAEETYGQDTEILVQEEDAQPIEVPIIAPTKQVKYEVPLDSRAAVRGPVEARASPDFLAAVLSTPDLIRNVTVAGHLHHGKTLFMDMLVEQTHDLPKHVSNFNTGKDPDLKPLKFTDTRVDEQARGISLKSIPMTLIAKNSKGKSYALSLFDTPGHLNFSDEMDSALRLSDGALLLVDAVEGVMSGTEQIIAQAAAEGLPLCLLITKVDRLMLELKLPPTDAFFKLRHIIGEVNSLMKLHYGPTATTVVGEKEKKKVLLDPLAGNVAFASALYGWSFTLESFAELYGKNNNINSGFNSKVFAKRLWGDYWFSPDTRTFAKSPPPGGRERTFVEFILNPIYKLHSQIIGEDSEAAAATLAQFGGVKLKPSSYSKNVKPLLKEAMSAVFGSATGIVDMLVRHIPSAREGGAVKLERCYTGPQDGLMAQHIRACNHKGPLAVYVCKLYPKPDIAISSFDALGRILSGTVKVGDRVKVLGEGFTPDDEEDCALATVTGVYCHQARYRVPMKQAMAGCWVLLEGIDATISKTATVVSDFTATTGGEEDLYIFAPIKHSTQSVVKIATEPLNPSELPKMVEGLRRLNKSYPLLVTKVEESGEHTLFGTGELYLDSVMKDLRELYGEVEVKVADPVVAFCETVVETSSLKCFAESPNKKNKLTMIAEPLDSGLAEDIERGIVRPEWSRKQLGSFLQSKYDWDLLAARSIWAFGPDRDGPNALLDDTLPGEVDKGLLTAIKESVVQGFQWGAREGPLCEEPMRNVKFKLLDASVAGEALHRGGGQIIPTARRVCYSSFLMATPRLMEPVYSVEIQTPADCISVIYNILGKRRGHITADVAKPGTPIFIVKAFLPVMESFGFETDLRYHTQGQAFCMSRFDHWSIVPGDPLDKNILLRPLEPAGMGALARDFMVKTRRRKGMVDDVSLSRFFDDPMLLELAQQEVLMERRQY